MAGAQRMAGADRVPQAANCRRGGAAPELYGGNKVKAVRYLAQIYRLDRGQSASQSLCGPRALWRSPLDMRPCCARRGPIHPV